MSFFFPMTHEPGYVKQGGGCRMPRCQPPPRRHPPDLPPSDTPTAVLGPPVTLRACSYHSRPIEVLYLPLRSGWSPPGRQLTAGCQYCAWSPSSDKVAVSSDTLFVSTHRPVCPPAWHEHHARHTFVQPAVLPHSQRGGRVGASVAGRHARVVHQRRVKGLRSIPFTRCRWLARGRRLTPPLAAEACARCPPPAGGLRIRR